MPYRVFEVRLNSQRVIETFSKREVGFYFQRKLETKKKSDTLTILADGHPIVEIGPESRPNMA